MNKTQKILQLARTGMVVSKIAKEVDCWPSVVYAALKKHGVEYKPCKRGPKPGPPSDKVVAILNLAADPNNPYEEIAKIHNVSRQYVQQIARAYGVPPRYKAYAARSERTT